MTATTDALNAEKQALLAEFSVEDLVKLWDATEAEMDSPTGDFQATCDVRGWLMDELESRDSNAFREWCDDPDMSNESLHRAFGV